MSCGTSFTFKSRAAKIERENKVFRGWLEKRTVKQLAQDYHCSAKKISRIVHGVLAQPPPTEKIHLKQITNVVFDGSFLQNRKETIIVLIDASNNKPVDVSFEAREGKKEEVKAFLLGLKDRGLNPESVTIDGLRSIKEAFRETWPNIFTQRCLFHIQKQGLSWCRHYPKSVEARKLKQIFKEIFMVKTREDKQRFIDATLNWEKTYGKRVCLDPSRGWVMSDLKRARSMLLKALPDMFYFLDSAVIPKTTNCAESFFSKIKDNVKIHRGLSPERRRSLIKKIVHFCRK